MNVRDPEIEQIIRRLGKLIGKQLPEGWGFLMLFTYGKDGSLFYRSSAQREDVINVMKEFIRRNTQ